MTKALDMLWENAKVTDEPEPEAKAEEKKPRRRAAKKAADTEA